MVIIFKNGSESEITFLDLKEEYQKVKTQREALFVEKMIEFCGTVFIFCLKLSKSKLKFIGVLTEKEVELTRTTNEIFQTNNSTLKITMNVQVSLLLLVIGLGLFLLQKNKKPRKKFHLKNIKIFFLNN